MARRPRVSTTLRPLPKQQRMDGAIYDPADGSVTHPDGRVTLLPIGQAFDIQATLDRRAMDPPQDTPSLSPSPDKEIPMATPKAPDTALVPTTPASSALVPPGLPFSAEEWGAMTPEDQKSAIIFWSEEQQETTEGLSVTFPRVKYPTSGSSFWEIPTASGEPEAKKTIEGVVVFKQPVRAYWPLGDAISNNPPTCSSLDAVMPIEGPGKQAPTCAACPHAQFGTGREGHGQACKSRLSTFLLMEHEEIPTLLSLPPTAIKGFSQYAVQLRKMNIPLLAITTIFGLTDAKSSGGVDYKALTLKTGRRLTYDEMKRARVVREMFEAQMSQRGLAVDEVKGEGEGGEAGRDVIETTAARSGDPGF